jgi:hypothetical protein
MTEYLKSLFNNLFTSDLGKEEQKAKDNLNKITADCTEKKAIAEKAFNEANAARVAKEAAEKAVKEAADATKLTTTGGKSRRKGSRKSKGKKNKKTRRN